MIASTEFSNQLPVLWMCPLRCLAYLDLPMAAAALRPDMWTPGQTQSNLRTTKESKNLLLLGTRLTSCTEIDENRNHTEFYWQRLYFEKCINNQNYSNFKCEELPENEVTQLCPTLCEPMDCGLPGSSVHGIFQARIVEWVAISFSRGFS